MGKRVDVVSSVGKVRLTVLKLKKIEAGFIRPARYVEKQLQRGKITD